MEKITYRFHVKDHPPFEMEMTFDDDFAYMPPGTESEPDWVALEHHQCHTCPLRTETHPSCPLAQALFPVIDFASDLLSYENATYEVVTEHRTYHIEGPSQRGFSSLMGLLIATSGCPKTRVLRPMARFHLPNATRLETMARIMSFFCLAGHWAGIPKDQLWDHIKAIYEDLHHLNTCIVKRIRSAVENDCSVNAIVILDAFTLFVPLEVDDPMTEIKTVLQPMIEALGPQ